MSQAHREVLRELMHKLNSLNDLSNYLMLLVDPHQSPIIFPAEIDKKIVGLLRTLSTVLDDLKNIIDDIQNDYNQSFWSSYKAHEQKIKEAVDAQEEYLRDLDEYSL